VQDLGRSPLEKVFSMGTVINRDDVSSISVKFEDGTEMTYSKGPKDVTQLTEDVDYGSIGDKARRVWVLKWVEKED
jgi:hypothetical protein